MRHLISNKFLTAIYAKFRLSGGSKIIAAFAVITLLGVSNAQASSVFEDFTTVSWVLFTVACVIFVMILQFLSEIFDLVEKVNKIRAKEAAKSGSKKSYQSVFSEFWDKFNRFRPLEEESEIETEHIYDGIKELDNITPPWFTIGFIGSIIIAIAYMWVYHVSKSAPLQIEEYEREVAIAEAKIAEYLKKQVGQIDESNVTLFTDQNSIANGKKTYDANCVACHRDDGGGSVGPNLTDEYWIHGGSVSEVFSTIKYGVIEKGMIPWKDELSARQIAEVVAYIHTLQGTNPPNGKAPEGDKYVEEELAENSEDMASEEV